MEFTGERCIVGKSGELLEKEHLARYEFALQYVDGKKVLDIGCGSGYGVDLIASKASEVIGVDISKEAMNYARQHYKRKNITFCVGDAIHLDFLKDRKFDVIICFEVIEHVANYFQCLKEIRRLLKHDGILIISTPNKRYYNPNSEKLVNPFHVIEFELADFKELLGKYFGNVKVFGQRYHQTNIKKMVKKLLPQRVCQMVFLRTARDVYNTRQASKFRDKNVENHSYFITICKK